MDVPIKNEKISVGIFFDLNKNISTGGAEDFALFH